MRNDEAESANESKLNQLPKSWKTSGRSDLVRTGKLRGPNVNDVSQPNTSIMSVKVYLDEDADLLDVNLERGVPCVSGPLYQAVLQLLPLMHGASSVGIAESALDEGVKLAKTDRQQLQVAVPMRDSERRDLLRKRARVACLSKCVCAAAPHQ
jgi:hypothetical protein